MMKRLFLCAISALFAFSASAVGTGDCVYTPSGRYLLGALQSSIDLSIPNDFEGWKSIGEDALLDNFDAVDGFVSTSAPANTKGLYKSFTLDNSEKTYVLVFDAKAPESNLAYSFTPKFLGANQAYIAHLNVYATEGAYVSTATAEATVSGQADLGLGFQLTSEYQTYATAFSNGGSDKTWFIEISQLLSGISVGNIQVYEATQVYDNRFVQNKIDYLNAIIGVYKWEDMTKTDEEAKLWNYIKAAPELLENMPNETGVEAGQAIVSEVNDSIVRFCNVLMGDFAAENKMRFEDDGTAVSKNTNPIAGWGGATTRWWHSKNASNVDWGRFLYSYNNSQPLSQKKTLTAGSYVFSIEAYMNSDTYRNTIENHDKNTTKYSAVCRGELTLSILNEEGEEVYAGQTVALDNQNYKTGFVAFNIPEGQDGTYTFKILAADTYAENGWTTNAKNGWGGTGYFNNLRIFFKPAGKYNAKQLAYIESVKTQINVMRTNYDKIVSYPDDSQYYWYKWAAEDTAAIYKPILEFYESLTDDDIINGFDDPCSKIAKEAWEAESGVEAPDWDYNLSYDKYNAGLQNAADSIYRYGVRPVRNLNTRFLAFNQYLFDLQATIEKAKVALNTRLFTEKIAYPTLEGVVGDVEAMFEEYKEDPGNYDDLVDSYIPAVQDVTNTMNESITNFYESDYNPGSEPVVIRNFDFENADAFVLDNPEDSPSPATYTDPTGVMTIANYEITEPVEGKVYYNNGLYKDGEWNNQGILRIGASNATIQLEGDDIVSGSDALHVAFDFYFGSLSGKSAGVYFKDIEDANVAGFWGSTYDNTWLTTAYNPFEINGGTDFNSKDNKGSDGELTIIQEANRTHFDFYIDYGTKSMFCIVNNAAKGAINKRYDVAKMENENPVACLVINSNYNYIGRRCAIDNIKIERIVLGSAPTPPAVKGDVNGDSVVNGADIQEVINVIVAGEFDAKADVNGDGKVNGADIQEIINIIVGAGVE